jgi:uncharacterized protein YcbK (DUF882 family)
MLDAVKKILKLLIDVILSLKNTSNQQSIDEKANQEKKEEVKMAITLEAYFADPKTGEDRRIKYAKDYSNEVLENAKILLEKVNSLLSDLGIVAVVVSSGWRPASINAAVGGAPRSLHMQGRAIDLRDSTGELDKLIESKPELLKKYDLWLEDPDATKGWSHLDTGVRRDRPSRVFKV